MRHLFTAIVTAVEAVAIALISLSIVAVAALLIWFGPLAMGVEANTMASTVASIWGLAHGVPITIDPSEQFLVASGLPPALSFKVSLMPLGLTAVTVFLAIKMSLRTDRNPLPHAFILIFATAGFALTSFVLLLFRSWFNELPAPTEVAIATSFFAIPTWITFLFKHFKTFVALPIRNRFLAEFLIYLPRIIRVNIVMAMTVTAVAAVAFIIAILVGYPQYSRINQMLQFDLVGEIIFFVGQLVFLPMILIWAASWMSGVGFHIGPNTSIDPLESLVGPLPAIPVFGLIPQGLGDWALVPILFILVISVAVGVFIGKSPELNNPPLLTVIGVTATAGLLLLAELAIIAVLGSGAIGPARMETVGVAPWPFAGVLALEVTGGLLVGLFISRANKYNRQMPRLGTLEMDPETLHDTQQIQERIADPSDDQQKPWFYAGIPHRSDEPAAQMDETDAVMNESAEIELEEDPLFSEEELLQEYSWEALVNQQKERED